MLTLTENASTIVKDIAAQQGVETHPAGSAVRTRKRV